MRPPSSAHSTSTVPVPMIRLLMMCLWASITCRAELRSIRWKPTKREAVRAPSRIWMSRKKEKVNSRLAMISVTQRRLRHLLSWIGVGAGMQLLGDQVAIALLVEMDGLRGRGDLLRLARFAAEHDLDLLEKTPLQ